MLYESTIKSEVEITHKKVHVCDSIRLYHIALVK